MNALRKILNRKHVGGLSISRGRQLNAQRHSRNQRLEALEDRRLLATFVVTNVDDAGTGSLRAAIATANDTAGADTIHFDAALSGQTIALAGTELQVTDALTIDATPLDNLTIDAGGQSRIFNIDDPDESFEHFDVTISGLTLTAGYTTADGSDGSGGAIRSVTLGDLTITHSVIRDSQTTGNSAKGGGLSATDRLTLIESTVSNNSTSGQSAGGGGIWASEDVTLVDSVVDGNRTFGDSARGGGIHTSIYDVTLTRSVVTGNSTAGVNADGGGIRCGQFSSHQSTVSGNTTTGNHAGGGGISSPYYYHATIDQSTISGNTTSGDSARGGGLEGEFRSLTITQSTISANTTSGLYAVGGGIASFGFDDSITLTQTTVTDNHVLHSSASGGGIWTNESAVHLHGTIVAGNSAGGGNDDIDPGEGAFTANHSLIGVADGLNLSGVGNQAGSATNPLDPQLGSLANNGGLTQTHAVLDGSPALDAGEPSFAGSFDQRGAPYQRFVGAAPDVGAFEVATIAVVNSLADNDDGNPHNGTTTLREAVNRANAFAGEDTIEFDTALSGQTITLSGSELVIHEGVTIDATTLTDNVTIDANNQSRHFLFDNPNVAQDEFDVTLSGLTLSGGRASGPIAEATGGAISSLSFGELNLVRSHVTGNSTTGDFNYGGGIWTFGSVTLIESSVSHNSTHGYLAFGGGILSHGEVTLTDSLVSNNFTLGDSANGGGIFTPDDVTLTRSTVGGNHTSGQSAHGGGIHSDGDITVIDSLVSGNYTTGDFAFGGGIYTLVGSLTVTRSSVSGNHTSGNRSYAGGIRAVQADVTVSNSTVSGNSTTGFRAHGGGIWVSGDLTLIQSTLSGNSTAGSEADGGGIHAFAAVTLMQSTVTNNQATGPDADGGGIFHHDLSQDPAITLAGSIVAGNTASGTAPDLLPDPDSALDFNYSLMGVADGLAFVGVGNLTGTAANPLDPQLTSLSDNGGPTETHGLMLDSPAIDAGDPAAMAGVGETPEFDQRGMGFDRVAHGRVDIGALEQQSTIGPDLNNDGFIDGVDIDLLQANIVTGPADPATFDLTGDGNVDVADRDVWLALAGAANLPSGNAFLIGDANLDGAVDGLDFILWNDNKFSVTSAWTGGDFNLDGIVDGLDFVAWNTNKFQSADAGQSPLNDLVDDDEDREVRWLSALDRLFALL